MLVFVVIQLVISPISKYNLSNNFSQFPIPLKYANGTLSYLLRSSTSCQIS